MLLFGLHSCSWPVLLELEQIQVAVHERNGCGVEVWEMPVQAEGRQRLRLMSEGPAEASEEQVRWAALVEGAEIVWVGAVGVGLEAERATQTEAAWVMSSEALRDLAVSGVDPEAAQTVCFGVQQWVLELRDDYLVRVEGLQDAPLLWVWGPRDEQEEEVWPEA